MAIKDTVRDHKVTAMKTKDAFRNQTLTAILAAAKQYEVDSRAPVTDDVMISLLNKMVKQRLDSIDQFSKASRSDLVDVEQREIAIIREFLPAAATQEQIAKVVEESLAKVGSRSPKDMGQIMALVKTELNGRADMTAVSKLVKSKLI